MPDLQSMSLFHDLIDVGYFCLIMAAFFKHGYISSEITSLFPMLISLCLIFISL